LEMGRWTHVSNLLRPPSGKPTRRGRAGVKREA